MRVMHGYRRLWKSICQGVGVTLLAGCQTVATNNPATIYFKIPPGSKLILNRELIIPAGTAHIMLQHGEAASAAGEYYVNCRFEVRNLGPRVIQPDTFLITRYGSQREWVNQPSIMRFYKVFHLKSERQPDIMPMICQYWDYPLMGRPVTIQEIQEALGSYFTFEFAR